MKMIRGNFYTGLLASTSCILSVSAMAQDSASAPAVEQAAAGAQQNSSQDIVVTARRRDERLLDVPVAITAVGGRTLETYQVSRVTDLGTSKNPRV